MKIASVAIPSLRLFPLDYIISEELLDLKVGDLVIVPFRNKELTGIVWEVDKEFPENTAKLKKIKQKAPLEFSVNPEIIKLIKWTNDYYLASIGSVVKLVLPVDISESPIKVYKQEISLDFVLPELSTEQQAALVLIKATTKPSILKGITGSGKTEVYFSLLAEYLQQEKQILIMLPEIALSEQIINRFIERFGFKPVIWNSRVSKAEKKKILRGILSNQVKIVIGARSSLFLPYSNLGLIIIDEEHDDSYKQDEGILYNARDMAIVRARFDKAQIVLCSATPSIETMNNTQDKYQLIELSTRYKNASLPTIQIVDMKKEKLAKNSYFSSILIKEVKNNLAAKKQTLLFLNRRGYSPLMLCKLCGYRFTCKACSAWLVVHKSAKKLECHHCGHQSKIHINCPECKELDSLTICGPGIERIEEEARLLFPRSVIEVLSKDHARDPEKTSDLLHRMEHSEIDILIGTQMITKGYHFPNLSLVGVIDADLGNVGGDLYSSERSYQLLHQVGGRAGRSGQPGLVLMQTYYPDNILFAYLKENREDKFLEYELATRKEANMPPFTRMASLTLSGKNDLQIFELAKFFVKMAPYASVKILGPSSALMAKLASKYRYRIVVISEKSFNLQKYLKTWLDRIKVPSSCHLKIDIDPKSFY